MVEILIVFASGTGDVLDVADSMTPRVILRDFQSMLGLCTWNQGNPKMIGFAGLLMMLNEISQVHSPSVIRTGLDS